MGSHVRPVRPGGAGGAAGAAGVGAVGIPVALRALPESPLWLQRAALLMYQMPVSLLSVRRRSSVSGAEQTADARPSAGSTAGFCDYAAFLKCPSSFGN
ncbi:hypothetical protein EYF80_047071 [Liparis tanakae]|uniref:Uncharacterized protein n=1 Tax=Liparis tanakae TaxID=230148 RepID=A0A4Z2FPC2_9TELE|nr:hypothetical protein EYF80_047071 [Liparis tanakae]